MARHKDEYWNLPAKAENWQQVEVALLMDIRDELKRLNMRLHCPEVTEGFRSIRKNYLYSRKRWPLKKRKKQ